MLVLALALAQLGQAVASERRLAGVRPLPSFARTCTISVPDPVPLFPSAPENVDAGEAAGEDEDEEADDDDDEGDDATPGLVIPGYGACLAVVGTLNFGVQRDWYKTNATTKSSGLVPPDATSFLPSATFRMETAQTLSNGLYLASAFEFQFSNITGTGTEVTIQEASVTLGPAVFGVAGSRFDFWAGDEFNFSARLPNRTVAILAYERALTSGLALSVSLEDSIQQPTSFLTVSNRRYPDGVVRLAWGREELTLHGALALRDIPRTASNPAKPGYGAIVGATWAGDLFGKGTTVTAQYAYASDAAAYIGSQLDRRVAGAVLLDVDATRGWSGVIALGREWSDTWSSNVYVSRYRLDVPFANALKGRVLLDRVSANLVWAPIRGLRTGLEASVAWQKIDITGRTIPVGLAGRLASVQLFLERGF